MNGMIAIIDATEVPNTTPFAFPAEMIAWNAPGWWLYLASAEEKPVRELAASTIISTTNAISGSRIRPKMIRATSLTEDSDSAATITITMRLRPKTQPSLVTELPALAIAVLWKTAPIPLSMNGVNSAAKCAVVDRM